ncbi:MAG: GTPase HflX [Myxococcales bacterium]|nr:GTPase HflX [Myxococcales bacterium]MDD9969814.1 GTPase HflX [Myxococcales bacterium]
MQIYGNTTGLSPSHRKALEQLYRRRVPFDRLTTPELSRALSEVSHAIHRQVGVLIHRSGQIEYVVVGDSAKLMLPDIGRMRAGSGRFRALRLVHTHLRNEPLTRDDLVDLTRLRLDMVAALSLARDGRVRTVHYAHNVPLPEDSQDDPFRTYGPVPYAQLDCDPSRIVGALEVEFARVGRARTVAAKDGRAILVHVCDKRNAIMARRSLSELRELARTAGVEVADTVLQVRDRVDPKFLLGRGRLEETVLRAMQLDVDVLIVDRNLTPAQATAIARMTDLKVLDRTQLILDIFAQHAQSLDGKLQVELAQTRYLLPRLGSKDDSLSRLTGGIGGRGPGETKLEVGRRRARERIAQLDARLKQLSRQRQQRRGRRSREAIPMVAIVGYTNAGKSTLLNVLTGSDVVAEDKLFATLDTRSRRMHLGLNRPEAVVTDTVGFIRNLPKDLFNAFRATFEEAADADLLLHVVDASDQAHDDHIAATEMLLAKLDLDQIPRLTVLNKTDRLDGNEAAHLAARLNGMPVSAQTGLGLDRLRSAIREAMQTRVEPPHPEGPTRIDHQGAG